MKRILILLTLIVLFMNGFTSGRAPASVQEKKMAHIQLEIREIMNEINERIEQGFSNPRELIEKRDQLQTVLNESFRKPKSPSSMATAKSQNDL